MTTPRPAAWPGRCCPTGTFAWALTAVEIVAGALLVAGLASRLGALLALGPAVFLFFVYFANDRWLPEQPLELVPLVQLALIPAGRWWGLDRRFPPGLAALRAGQCEGTSNVTDAVDPTSLSRRRFLVAP